MAEDKSQLAYFDVSRLPEPAREMAAEINEIIANAEGAKGKPFATTLLTALTLGQMTSLLGMALRISGAPQPVREAVGQAFTGLAARSMQFSSIGAGLTGDQLAEVLAMSAQLDKRLDATAQAIARALGGGLLPPDL